MTRHFQNRQERAVDSVARLNSEGQEEFSSQWKLKSHTSEGWVEGIGIRSDPPTLIPENEGESIEFKK